MRIFRIILTFILLQVSFTTIAQEEPNKAVVNSLDLEINDFKELDSINWNHLFSVFEENEPKDSIAVSIQVKDLTLDGENKVTINSMTVSVNGLTENRKNLQETLKDRMDGMITLFEKMTE